MRQIGAISFSAMARCLSCANHVKNILRHNAAVALKHRNPGSENAGQVAPPRKNIQQLEPSYGLVVL